METALKKKKKTVCVQLPRQINKQDEKIVCYGHLFKQSRPRSAPGDPAGCPPSPSATQAADPSFHFYDGPQSLHQQWCSRDTLADVEDVTWGNLPGYLYMAALYWIPWPNIPNILRLNGRPGRSLSSWINYRAGGGAVTHSLNLSPHRIPQK